jgi:hypothetical protein
VNAPRTECFPLQLSTRAMTAVRLAAVSGFVLLFAGLPTAELSAQPAPPRATGWELPRTPWGHPDLQGNWSNATLTPFERPQGRGATLSWEEVADLEAGRARAFEVAVDLDPNRPPPPGGGTNPVCIDGPRSCYDGVYLDPGEKVAVVNGEPRSSLVTRPADGRVPPVTEEARARMADNRARTAGLGQYDHPELRPLGERCVIAFGTSAGPPMLPNGWYNNNYTIVQNQDHILIMTEMVHDVRVIRLGERNSLPAHVRPWFGDSWGRWEGNTLVVETTNFNPDQSFRSVPPTERTKVIERFTRVDEETIVYEFTIDDPSSYAIAWGGEIPFKKFDQRLYEYACHEGNYALEGVLRGARFEETQASR